MAWLSIDARLATTPAMFHAGVGAYGVYIAAFSYCAEVKSKNGIFHPDDVFPGLTGEPAEALCQRLTAEGALRPRARGRYQLVNYPRGIYDMVRIAWERPKIEKWLRRAIIARDHVCRYCGSSDRLQIDHVHPVSRGGGSGPENLQALCAPCNRDKSNRLPNEVP